MKNVFLFLLFLSCLSSASFAQEPQFSNFYATHLYTNPAFTGRSGYQYRASTNFRRQWNNIGSFTTAFFSADYTFSQFGVGITTYADEAGSTPLSTVHSAVSLSYGIRVTRKADLVMGFQGSYYQQRLNEDYIWIDDYLNNNTSFISPGIRNQYFNLGAGLLLIHETFWLGFSLKDFLPNPGLNGNAGFSLISAHRNADAYYGRLSVHGGYYRYLLPARLLFSSYFNLRARGMVRQWEGGFNVAYRPGVGNSQSPIVVGIGGGYRGLMRVSDQLSRNDAVILNLSFTWPKGFTRRVNPLWEHQIQINYSYDMTVSGLKDTGGGHEVTLALKFSDLRPGSSWPETSSKRRHVADPNVCKGGSVKDVYVPR